ncbi:MAG: HNH endonuclease, partial [Ramlibacter sp.]|nr:HNH endonuclease [Cryobacterium sp.]
VDLADEHGVGWIDGVEAPISMRTVKRLICAGGYRKIAFGANGEVLHLGVRQRFFNRAQRRAIAARDGGCIIPGCTVSAAWAEVHHVIPWAQHGPTDISNGVLLCWLHHHSIETSGWLIRMVRGKPEVMAPLCYDAARTWVPAQQHRATTRTK